MPVVILEPDFIAISILIPIPETFKLFSEKNWFMVEYQVKKRAVVDKKFGNAKIKLSFWENRKPPNTFFK